MKAIPAAALISLFVVASSGTRAAQDYRALNTSGITPEAIVSELTAGGATASLDHLNTPKGPVPQIIAQNGPLKILLVLAPCSAAADKICDVQFNLLRADDKNGVDEKILAQINNAASYIKATKVARNDGTNLLRISYNYFCGGLDTPKQIAVMFGLFSTDTANAIKAVIDATPPG